MSDNPGRSGPLILLDGMSLAFRAFFAVPTDLVTESGTVTNAVHGFASMLVNLVRDHCPSALAVAFDAPGDTFRDEALPDYKGGRSATPDDLSPQFDMIREVLGSLAVPLVEAVGFEADDVLATLATEARDRKCQVMVVTGDRDCFQLVDDPYVRVLYNRRGVSDYTLYDEAGIKERTGVLPSSYAALAALRGDPSDNIPGVPGVGEKTAAKLLNSYSDLDGIFTNLAALTPKLRQNLADWEETVRLNASMIPLIRDVKLDVNVMDLDLGGWDIDTVLELFERYELRTVLGRLMPLLEDGSFGSPSPTSRPLAEVAAGVGSAALAEQGAQNEGASEKDTSGQDAVDRDKPLLVEAPGPEPELPQTALQAGELIGEVALAAATSGLTVAGRWEGLPGRSALRGVLMASGNPPDQAVWIGPSLLDDPKVRDSLSAAFHDIPVAGHELKELLRSLLGLGFECPEVEIDTAVAAYLLDSSTGEYSLDSVAAPYLKRSEDVAVPLPSGQLALGQEIDLESEAREDRDLAASEVGTVRQLVVPLTEALEREGLGPLHREIEMPLIGVLARMEVVGVAVDITELRRIAAELVKDARGLEEEVQRLAGHAFNVNSTPQLRTVLYEELGLTPTRRTKTGFSTDAATLETLRDLHPIVETLLRYREVEKLRSTYGESLISEVASDGRIHATFRQTVARTGRLSSERPNLHNIPVRTESGRRFRRAFVPGEGFKFLVADYDQIELRVIAHLSGDPGLVKALTSGEDVHRVVASGVYGLPAEEVTHTQREQAKMVSYGLAYGMEAYGLARRLGSGVDEASEIIDRYFRAFPLVRSYMDTTVEEARARGFTRTAVGRIRPLPELRDKNFRVRQAAERQAMNAGIQGLAADLFKTALVRIDKAFRDAGHQSRLVLQVHDEVLIEVWQGEEDKVGQLVQEALTGAAELRVPLEVSTAWGSSWAAAKGG